MSLDVVSFCGYLCTVDFNWRPEDHNSHKFIQALKGEMLNGWAWVPISGERKKLSNSNLGEAAVWFAILARDYLQKNKYRGPSIFIPIPNHDTLIGADAAPSTLALAEAICGVLGNSSIVVDCLRWRKDLGSASEDNGPREARILFGNLAIPKGSIAKLEKTSKIILVDDVTTSGGHLQACAAKLKKHGYKTQLAICAGKTVYDQENEAFHTYQDTLEEFVPETIES